MANHPNSINEDILPLTPEEMKAIGEIELGPSRHEKFLNAHYKKLIIITIVVMMAAVACIVYVTWRAHQEADGSSAIVSVLKTDAVCNAADAAAYDAAALDAIEADYNDTKAAATAELLRGMRLVAGGQEQEGVNVLQNVIASSPQGFLRMRAQAYLAGHYMSGGDAAKANELWQAVVRAGKTPYLALAYLSLGDIAAESGEADQAHAYYTKLQEECPSSPLMPTVQQRLMLLGVDAPEPVAPAPAPAPAQTPSSDMNMGNFSIGLPQ